MKILVIGGTRLLGLALVRRLVASGHMVTVISRRLENFLPGTESIGGERGHGLERLAHRTFDFTFDFLAYDDAATSEVFTYLDPGVYVLISSTWMVRLNRSTSIDEPVFRINEDEANLLPEVTSSYLKKKMLAESTVLKLRGLNRTASILRLPIFLGENEHTGRLDFYLQRVNDGSPIICINGGYNIAQIAWVEDVSQALIPWISLANERPIWNAIPDAGTCVRDIIAIIAKGKGKEPSLENYSREQLSQSLPEYLMREPFWRETPIKTGKGNIFTSTGVKPTPISTWLCGLRGRAEKVMTELRKKEILFLKNIR